MDRKGSFSDADSFNFYVFDQVKTAAAYPAGALTRRARTPASHQARLRAGCLATLRGIAEVCTGFADVEALVFITAGRVYRLIPSLFLYHVSALHKALRGRQRSLQVSHAPPCSLRPGVTNTGGGSLRSSLPPVFVPPGLVHGVACSALGSLLPPPWLLFRHCRRLLTHSGHALAMPVYWSLRSVRERLWPAAGRLVRTRRRRSCYIASLIYKVHFPAPQRRQNPCILLQCPAVWPGCLRASAPRGQLVLQSSW